MKDLIRTCHFHPYLKGLGPTFTLRLFDTGHTSDGNGLSSKNVLAYQLTMREVNRPSIVLFEGQDFCCSPLHAIDSDECVASLMGFLTLRPGDTDKEYFKDYTQVQLDYCSSYAEALSSEVLNRFGER